ncbi:TauD/TfdA family dioxygenase [Parvibaculum sp.]|uniref:TauD/TfdA dioxygenase family protein n=1 Tax=Parvibaculum sp. TaxID=2024848 RepID=UPI00320EE32B
MAYAVGVRDRVEAREGEGTAFVKPVSASAGAEIGGIDLSRPLSEADRLTIRQAILDYGVVFFRDQNLTPEQHIAFAERFGPININRFFAHVPGYPQIAEVRKEPEQKINVGGGWHTDHSYDQIPALGSVLVARELPELGGDTIFANLALAYDALSDGLKRTLEGLNAVHSSRHVFGYQAAAKAPDKVADLKNRIGNPDAATQDAIHPVVLRHPESGKKILYVNPGFTVNFEGWTAEESASLLAYLYKHATRPEFSYRFQWQEGSIAFWDNRSTWHAAVNDYHGRRRVMHRITIEGTPLV